MEQKTDNTEIFLVPTLMCQTQHASDSEAILIPKPIEQKVKIRAGLPGEPGPPGERGYPGVVSNDFTQYVLKIVDSSVINTSYQSANDRTFAGYSLVYLTNDNLYVDNIEICNNSVLNPTTLSFRIIPNQKSRIAVVIINSVGCYTNTFPITSGVSGNNVESNQTVVTLNLQNGTYQGYVAAGATFTVTIRWY